MNVLSRGMLARASLLLVPSMFVLGSACGSSGIDGQSDDVGEAVVALTQAPADVACVRVTAAGSRTVVRSFDVTAGASTSFTLTGLALGNVVFSGEAFQAACSTLTASSIANWVSDPVTATLATGTLPTVNLVMRRNGRAAVGVDFQDDSPAATCTDTVKNGSETDVDCGGGVCPKCLIGKSCATAADCATNLCLAGTCTTLVIAPTCTDSIKNGAETDVDCGGPTCPKCPLGKSCTSGVDCTSNLCLGGTCSILVIAPSCTDAIKNGSETDVDCGGTTCPKCAVGKSCSVGLDCVSGTCTGGSCH